MRPQRENHDNELERKSLFRMRCTDHHSCAINRGGASDDLEGWLPCPDNRTGEMWSALEQETGCNYHRITDSDLADVNRLLVSGSFKWSDFAGLDNLQTLNLGVSGRDSGLTELPPGAFDVPTNLQTRTWGATA